MTENNSYKIDHRYNQNNTPMMPTNGQTSVKSYREQIETMLTRWHQLQKSKQQQQCEPINFDNIMETDLARQLHEIEEQEQYNLLEKTLELQQLNQADKQDDTKKQLKQIEILKQSEKNEQQRAYDRILQQLKQYEKLEINKNNSQHKKVNIFFFFLLFMYIGIYFKENKLFKRICLYLSTKT
jgi:molybdopterin-biosynthesis enzyme MoeA-like protein